MSTIRRGRLWASFRFLRTRAVSRPVWPWGQRRVGTLEPLEPRTLLSSASLVDLDLSNATLGAPVARDDYYWTPADTALVVPAPGVLANDSEPDGQWLEAWNLYGNMELEHGTLIWDFWTVDGSFTYVPNAGYNGPDQFMYYAVDPDGNGDQATVTIDVGIFNRAPRVASPIPNIVVDQGAPDTVIELAGVFDDLDIPGGDQLTYSVTVSPPILPIVNQVSQSSYEDIHGNLLYTHLGDNRAVGGPEHDLARDNIYDYFQGLGLTTSLDTISDVEDVLGDWYHFDPPLVNVVGVKPGVTHPDNVYIVGAHYDSVGNPGADDNASGVAAVMEIARVLSAYSFDCTLEFIAFDGEEEGLFGSMHYAEFHTQGKQILGMVSLDMIAFNQSGEGHDAVSLYDSDDQGPIKPNLIEAFAEYGAGLTVVDMGALDLSDHAPFEWFDYDAALVIESAMDDPLGTWEFKNPYYHTADDAVETPDYIDYEYATNITRAVAGYLAQSARPLSTVNVLTASVAGDQLTLDYDPSKSGGAVVTVRATDIDGLFAEDLFSVTVQDPVNATIVGRSIFYNNSYFDGNPTVGRDDDNAIALDKQALLPGQPATFANYVSYSKGINGIMIDFDALPGSLTTADFQFAVGNTATPESWTAGPQPTINIRRDVGPELVDRVVLVWPDAPNPGSITKQWLQVTVLANERTGLADPDVFYFGNAMGDSGLGNTTTRAYVDGVDFAGARDNSHNFANRALIDDAFDYNRDSFVDGTDLAIVRDNNTNLATALKLFTVPGGSGVAAARATWFGPGYSSGRLLPAVIEATPVTFAQPAVAVAMQEVVPGPALVVSVAAPLGDATDHQAAEEVRLTESGLRSRAAARRKPWPADIETLTVVSDDLLALLAEAVARSPMTPGR
ncbi:MAG: M28 family peptidase [Pirellulaceae bacterium]